MMRNRISVGAPCTKTPGSILGSGKCSQNFPVSFQNLANMNHWRICTDCQIDCSLTQELEMHKNQPQRYDQSSQGRARKSCMDLGPENFHCVLSL